MAAQPPPPRMSSNVAAVNCNHPYALSSLLSTRKDARSSRIQGEPFRTGASQNYHDVLQLQDAAGLSLLLREQGPLKDGGYATAPPPTAAVASSSSSHPQHSHATKKPPPPPSFQNNPDKAMPAAAPRRNNNNDTSNDTSNSSNTYANPYASSSSSSRSSQAKAAASQSSLLSATATGTHTTSTATDDNNHHNHSHGTLLAQILPQLRPFQREGLEFAVSGTRYSRQLHDGTTAPTATVSTTSTNISVERSTHAAAAIPIPTNETPPLLLPNSSNNNSVVPLVVGQGRILLGDEMGLGE